MPADRDQTKSRKFVVLAGVAMLALVLLAGAFIVLNPLQRGGKALRPGEESSSRKGAGTDDEDAEGGKTSEPRASASGSAVKPAEPRKTPRQPEPTVAMAEANRPSPKMKARPPTSTSKKSAAR